MLSHTTVVHPITEGRFNGITYLFILSCYCALCFKDQIELDLFCTYRNIYVLYIELDHLNTSLNHSIPHTLFYSTPSQINTKTLITICI